MNVDAALMVVEANVAKALANPLRAELLARLDGREASPVELADEVGAKLGDVAYHVGVLHELGLIRLVSTAPRRGAVEHFYTAVVRARVVAETIE